jgi:hypothetical protein
MEFKELSLAPASPGIYIFYDKDGTCLYVGSSLNMRRRCKNHIHGKIAHHAEYREFPACEIDKKEREFILELRPSLNVLCFRSKNVMCDTSLISMRIPNALLAAIDAQAKAEDRSRSKVIVMRLSGDSSNARIQSREDRRIKRTAAAEPLMRVRSQSDEGDSQPRPKPFHITRPAHAPNCSCGMCRPSK